MWPTLFLIQFNLFLILFNIVYSDISPCSLKPFERDGCLADRFQSFIKIIQRSREKVNEVAVSDFEYNDIDTDALEGSVILKEVKFSNFMDAIVENLNSTLDGNKLSVSALLTISKGSMKCVSVVDISFRNDMNNYEDMIAKGDTTANLHNISAKVSAEFEIYKELGAKFMKMTDVKGKILCESISRENAVFDFKSKSKSSFRSNYIIFKHYHVSFYFIFLLLPQISLLQLHLMLTQRNFVSK
jgi:hypothetical protein